MSELVYLVSAGLLRMRLRSAAEWDGSCDARRAVGGSRGEGERGFLRIRRGGGRGRHVERLRVLQKECSRSKVRRKRTRKQAFPYR